MSKASLYYHTIKNMKPSQVFNRLRIRLGMGCKLGIRASGQYTGVRTVDSLDCLDFDPVFLRRFPAEELMQDRVTILHSSKDMDWKTTWQFDDRSALWNFNLHYFEYLFPLVKAWKDTGEAKYLNKTIEIIKGWVHGNPEGKGPAWSSYTTALRISTWISYYGYVCESISEDFRQLLLESLHKQYVYLTGHLEKDILGNHYFEDLKSLVLASLFFRDEAVFSKVLDDFRDECAEEILPDGMHFELSPMYHKIIFEGMLRVASALRSAGCRDEVIESYLQPMLDVSYSFEEGLDRIPLFNDGGNNVAKSLEALMTAADRMFGLRPVFRKRLEAGGYCFLKNDFGGHSWKLVVDAGMPGPKYIPGHAHCDAMSYELFCDGMPMLVNCGTFAYQCGERSFFRSTAAHNTVMINGTEQSQCWGAFRLAKRSSTRILDVTDRSVSMEMTDQRGQKAKRTITLSDKLTVTDEAEGKKLTAFVHVLGNTEAVTTGCPVEEKRSKYAEDYGRMQEIATLVLSSADRVEMSIDLAKLVL